MSQGELTGREKLMLWAAALIIAIACMYDCGPVPPRADKPATWHAGEVLA